MEYKSYISLLKATPYRWDSLNFEHLDKNKVQWMVKTNFLNLTPSNFTKLKEHFPDEHIRLIENQQNKLFSIFDDLALDTKDILLMLKSEIIKNKFELIKRIDDSFIIDDKNIAKSVCDVLAAANSILLNFDVLESLINSSASKENKIKVLNKQAEDLDDSQLQDLVELLGGNYQKIFEKKRRPTFSDTKGNRLLFDKLQKKGLIIKYKDEKDDQLRVFANHN